MRGSLDEKSQPLNVTVLAVINIDGRINHSLVEQFLVCDVDVDAFAISLGVPGHGCIGHIVYRRVPGASEQVLGGIRPLFQAEKLVSADCPMPCPAASLSGVLWTRMAALEAHQSIASSLAEEGPRAQSSVLAEHGGSRHET